MIMIPYYVQVESERSESFTLVVDDDVGTVTQNSSA